MYWGELIDWITCISAPADKYNILPQFYMFLTLDESKFNTTRSWTLIAGVSFSAPMGDRAPCTLLSSEITLPWPDCDQILLVSIAKGLCRFWYGTLIAMFGTHDYPVFCRTLMPLTTGWMSIPRQSIMHHWHHMNLYDQEVHLRQLLKF